MKKLLAAILTAVFLLPAGAASVFAQRQDHNETAPHREERRVCTQYADTNGDGICDNFGSAHCTHADCDTFVDANGDGVCDNFGSAHCTHADCDTFVDANGDGV